MAWFYLTLAGLFEIVWAVSLKSSNGLTRPWPSILTLLALIVSMGLLALAMRSLPLGTAYAVWTGIGALGAFIVGIAWFQESADPARIICAALIIFGVLGLKFFSAE